MKAHRYSDALRRIAPALAGDRRGGDYLRTLARWERDTDGRDGFDTACAVYWFAANWHAGQGCALYSALCATGYEPARGERDTDPATVAGMIREELEAIHDSANTAYVVRRAAAQGGAP